MSSKGQHVVPSGGRWSVRKAGSERASGVFDTQREAISAARGIAKNQGSELYIHGEDGRIRRHESPAKDRPASKD